MSFLCRVPGTESFDLTLAGCRVTPEHRKADVHRQAPGEQTENDGQGQIPYVAMLVRVKLILLSCSMNLILSKMVSMGHVSKPQDAVEADGVVCLESEDVAEPSPDVSLLKVKVPPWLSLFPLINEDWNFAPLTPRAVPATLRRGENGEDPKEWKGKLLRCLFPVLRPKEMDTVFSHTASRNLTAVKI